MARKYSSGHFCSLFFVFSALSCAVVSCAQEVAKTSPKDQTLRAQSFVSERLWVWQKRLGLQEWKISVVMSPSRDLQSKTVGNIHWELDKKTAVIHILDPADYRLPFPEMLKDMEFTVVHELVHLDMAPVLSELQRSDANRREEEHAVNHMVEALLKLDRQR